LKNGGTRHPPPVITGKQAKFIMSSIFREPERESKNERPASALCSSGEREYRGTPVCCSSTLQQIGGLAELLVNRVIDRVGKA